MSKRKSIITKIDGKPIIKPGSSIDVNLKKFRRPKTEKVWLTIQLPRTLRNEISKASVLLNINVSKYLRKKLIDLVNAAKLGHVPKYEEFEDLEKRATIDTKLDTQT